MNRKTKNEKNGDSKDRRIRPPFPAPRLSELVGQDEIRRRLTDAVKTARSAGTCVPHILFTGPPGLGKRTFAESFAREVDVVSGAGLKHVKDIFPYLTNAAKDSVLFVGDIDQIPSPDAAEYIAAAMRDFAVPLTFGEGEKVRTVNLTLKKFTLIGAAAEPDRVDPRILEQFGIREHFDFYTPEELSVMIRRAAARLGLSFDGAAVSEIARRSGGRSGKTFDLIRSVWNGAQTRREEKISLEFVLRAIETETGGA